MDKNIKRHILSLLNKQMRVSSLVFVFLLFNLFFLSGLSTAYSQAFNQPYYYTGNQPSTNYMANSSAFKQEIARMEINVVRQGKAPMSITQVPRLEKGDVLKMRLLDEPVNGAKPDQSNFDWTFLVAFINPGRNSDKETSVTEEIQFRKSGWYKEYSFTVPYDSQPVFFLYPKPKYRAKILNLISKNQEEIRKIGEKTIEIAGAYAKIGSFLNELQSVLYRNSYGGYGSYGSNFNNSQNNFKEQAIESLAKSFNIQLPSCWGGSNTYGGYNNYSNYSSYSGYGSNDFTGRVQCVARSIRLEDFDLSVSKMLQQGGILAAAQLSQKYPQIAHWINIAAIALDLILKITKKTPLKLVPTVISTNENQGQNLGYQNNYAGAPQYSNNAAAGLVSESVKISLFAESQPRDDGFVTAYPLVVHKWQANPDPEVISLPTPSLMEPCLHAGQNILRSTDLMSDWMSDTFTKDFQLVISSPNGFRKQFPLKKNSGMNGWELNLTKEDLNAFPKIKMTLESVITGKRGFNEIKSPKFELAIPIASGGWEIEPESQKAFAVGGKRAITLRNQLGNCRCLQAVVYKPSFGGQFVFEANNKVNGLIFSDDGKEVSFEVDATGFQPGQGQLELQTYGAEVATLNINLYPAPPNITGFKISKGENQAVIIGERLEQLRAVKINGKRAIVQGNSVGNPTINQYALSGEKVAVFEDPNARQDSNVISLELELEGNRNYKYPKTFTVSAARPSIVANQAREVEAITSANKITVNAKNALTDYDFKVENIQIETKIENSQINSTELPKADFEVLDWKNMQISFQLNEQFQRLLGGRRLQFRIRDRERGDSPWYTVQKPFVRKSLRASAQSK